MRRPFFHATAFAVLFTGCAGTNSWLSNDTPTESKPKLDQPRPHDPNEIVVQTTDGVDPNVRGDATSQLSARTTLLEDNEHLRDLLAKALAERRETEQKLSDATIRCASLETEVSGLRETVAQLSEQIDGQTTKIAELERVKSKLEKDRATLAEMYALEKRQRLAFEKELLEREIRSRTLSKDG